jgi:biopolymer transport protein ExbD
VKFEHTTAEEVDPFQLPAMVDMVFILLAFFILATQTRILENDFSMGYQPDSSADGAAAGDLPENIPIEMESAPGGVAIRIGQAQLPLNDFAAIGERLSQINLPRVPVVLLADPALTVEQVSRALDAVLGSPMNNVSVGTLNVAVPVER